MCFNPFGFPPFDDVAEFIFSRRLGGGGGVFERLRRSSEEELLDRLVILLGCCHCGLFATDSGVGLGTIAYGGGDF